MVNPNLIRKCRLKKGMTLDDVFLKTGIHMPKLSRIERGIFKASSKERKLISRALGISIRDLFPKD
jgi:transcriptional regulator with XRE-family HTH domain